MRMKPIKKILAAALALTLALSLAACGKSKAATRAFDLDGTTVTVSFGKGYEISDGNTATVTKDGERICTVAVEIPDMFDFYHGAVESSAKNSFVEDADGQFLAEVPNESDLAEYDYICLAPDRAACVILSNEGGTMGGLSDIEDAFGAMSVSAK